MNFIHIKCGGEIDKKNRICQGCGRRWNIISFLFTRELRATPAGRSSLESRIASKVEKVSRRGGTSYASWGDDYPGVGWLASHLPNWKRRYRILSSLVVWGLLVWGCVWLAQTYGHYVTNNWEYILGISLILLGIRLCLRFRR